MSCPAYRAYDRRATVFLLSFSANVAPTRGEMSFQSIVVPPPAYDSVGSRSGNAVFAGAVLPWFEAVCLSQRTPPFNVSRPEL